MARRPGKATQAARILRTMRLLITRTEGLRAEDLGKLTGVTPRQARRDIDVLTESGIDVYFDGSRYSLDQKQVREHLGTG